MLTADGSTIQYVQDPASYAQLCQELDASSSLALDTEFLRTSTFYAQLGLIQIADPRGCYLIDPLPLTDQSALINLLKDSNKTFVMHSCSEDLNLLHTSFSALPANLFDTQIAAAFLGLGFSLSYQALVNVMLGIEIPKDETRSDWIKRPLSEAQKLYAATDVCHLLQIQQMLEEQLRQKNVYDWFHQECQDQLKTASEAEKADRWQLAYASVSNAWRLDDTGLETLQALCIWREQVARNRNKPRNWIAKDNDLLLVAGHFASGEAFSSDALADITELDKHLNNRYGQEMIGFLQENVGEFGVVERDLLTLPLSPPARKKLKACQHVVQTKAGEIDIAPELLGRKKFIMELVRTHEQNGAAVWPGPESDWRRPILEEDFNRILTGSIG